MEGPLPVSDDMFVMHRNPKPELLQLLFEHMPAPAQQASKHADSNGHSSQDTSALRNGNGHHADGNSTSMYGNSQTSNGHSKPANGHSHAAEINGHSSSGNGKDSHSSQNGNSSNKPVIHVDGHANGISQDEAHQQARELQDVLQDEVEAYLDKRHIIDILHDFSGCQPPLATLLSCLRPLQPRLYSISSSQLEHRTHVQITVAVVKYMALGRNRIGVTSTFLKERMQVGCITCGLGPLLFVVHKPVAVCKLMAQLAATVHAISASWAFKAVDNHPMPLEAQQQIFLYHCVPSAVPANCHAMLCSYLGMACILMISCYCQQHLLQIKICSRCSVNSDAAGGISGG